MAKSASKISTTIRRSSVEVERFANSVVAIEKAPSCLTH